MVDGGWVVGDGWVVGGWWWKTKFSVHLSPKLNNNVCAGEWETPHTLLLTVVTLFSHSQKGLYNGPFEKNCLNLYTFEG